MGIWGFDPTFMLASWALTTYLMVAEDIQANIIAKYQNWKYSTGDLVDSFENMVNPERIRSTIMQKMLDTQYKTRHGGDKGKHHQHGTSNCHR